MSDLQVSTLSLLEDLTHGLSLEQSRLFGNFTLRTAVESAESNWSEREASQRRTEAIRIASAAMTAEEAGDSERAQIAYRRAAELLEWLEPENLDDEGLLLSAAFYQLAELPAMARSILAASDLDENIYAAFLAGDFPRFERLAKNVTSEFGDDPRVSSLDLSTRSLISRNFLAALNIVVAEMRWGNMPVAAALVSLDQVVEYYKLSRAYTGWLFARVFRQMADKFTSTSIRAVTNPVAADLSSAGKSAIERYARGAYQKGRSLAWPTQRRGLERLARDGNFALCTPTGSGKTMIAEIAIIQSLFAVADGWDAIGFGRLALYVVPSRALAAEVESRLAAAFSDQTAFPIRVVSSYGGNDVSGSEAWLTSQSATVIVCTQEKTDALVRAAGPLFLNRLKLVIVDEAHAVAVRDPNFYERQLRLETLVSRIRMLRDADVRVVALSAVVAESDDSLGRWLDSSAPDTIRVPYQSTRHLFGRLVVDPQGRFLAEYDLVNGSLSGGKADAGERPRIPGIVPDFPHMPPAPKRNGKSWTGTEMQLRAAALWSAMHLARLGSATSGAVLITVSSKIEDYAAAFLGYLNQWTDQPEFYVEPNREDDLSVLNAAKLACADYFGDSSQEFRLLSRGIVVHHGRLPISLSRHFVRLVERGIIRICLATSTLSEGINLPFETILLPTLRGHTGTGAYSAEEIRNVIGRAGRPGFAREGRALVLIGTGRPFMYGAQLYLKLLNELTNGSAETPIRSALGTLLNVLVDEWRRLGSKKLAFTDWLESITSAELFENARPKSAEAIEDLDAFLIAATVELEDVLGIDLETPELEARLISLWQHTYLFALNQTELVRDALLSRARYVRASADLEDLRKIYRTSMRPRSAKKLIEIAPDVGDHLRTASNYARWSNDERLAFFETLIVELQDVPQFDFRSDFGTKAPTWRDALRWWVGEFDAIVPEKKIGRWFQLSNRAFSFKLTWAFSSALLTLLEPSPMNGDNLEEQLTNAKLPLVVQWFRDMLIVGVLDPVAAILMQRGLVGTRSEAKAAGIEYYTSFGIELADSCFAKAAIYDWIESRFGRVDEANPEQGATRTVVDAVPLQDDRYRVWPSISHDGALWRDVSGYPIATSRESDGIRGQWFDHTLIVGESTIVSSPYLTVSQSGAHDVQP